MANATTPDTGAPNTAAEADVIDNNTQPPEGSASPALAEDDAILAAIRGEDEPKAGEDAPTPEGAAPPQDKAAEPDKGGNEGKAPAKAEANADAILDDDTPKDYKGRTREQFEKLKERGREYREEALAYKAKLEELAPNIEREANFTKLLVESGGTPEDIGTSISLIRAVNKGTAEEKQNALQIVEAIRGILADQLGTPVAGIDYLKDYPDLQKRVDEGDLSREDAIELAVAKRHTRTVGETQAQAAARERKAAEEQQAKDTELTQRQSAAHEVSAAATAFQQRDGQAAYEVRVTYAKQAFARIQSVNPVPPAKIPALFRDLYESDEAKLLADATLAKSRTTVAGVRPVMGARMGGTGAAQPEAQSEEDAVRLALRGG